MLFSKIHKPQSIINYNSPIDRNCYCRSASKFGNIYLEQIKSCSPKTKIQDDHVILNSRSNVIDKTLVINIVIGS